MLTPKKNLVSLIRAIVKPEYQNDALDDAIKLASYATLVKIPSHATLHGISISIPIDKSLFESCDPNDWDKYPKHKPIKDGIYRIRYENGGEYLRRWKDGRWYDLSGVVKSNVFCKDSIEFKWFGEEI